MHDIDDIRRQKQELETEVRILKKKSNALKIAQRLRDGQITHSSNVEAAMVIESLVREIDRLTQRKHHEHR